MYIFGKEFKSLKSTAKANNSIILKNNNVVVKINFDIYFDSHWPLLRMK